VKSKHDKKRQAAKRRARAVRKKREQRSESASAERRRAAERQERLAEAKSAAGDRAVAVHACGGCAACCRLMAVPELDKAAGQACEHARIAAGGCCSIYDERPGSCRQFLCHWAAGGLEPDLGLRPDRLGVMLGWEDEHAATGKPWFQAWEARPGGLAEPGARRVLDAVARDYVVAVMSEVPAKLRLPRLLGPAADIAKIKAWVDARRPRG
jgi:hypothetical protein